MTLHIISRSPFESPSFLDCLGLLQPGDAVLLMDDGVYGLVQPELQAAGVGLYFLIIDAESRGVVPDPSTGATAVDYDGMVRLTEQYHPSHSWG